MTDHNKTSRALARITDEGLFEKLATDILRRAKPSLYAYLGQPGVNADGKTKKSPVDSVAYIPGANPPHLITAHHTTCIDKKLKNKWLFNPKENNLKKIIKQLGMLLRQSKSLKITVRVARN